MNKNTIQYLTVCGFALCVAFLTGCTSEDELIHGTTGSLSIRPTVSDAKATRASTVADVSALNEDKVAKLDVVIAGTDGVKLNKTINSPVAGSENLLVEANNWKSAYGLTDDTKYSVYSVANASNFKDASGNALSLSNITPTDNLTKLTVVDDNIYKPYSSSNTSDEHVDKDKTFLMDNKVDYTITSEATQTIEGVTLKRATAKIEVSLTVNVAGYTAGNPQWCFKNYYTKTSVTDNNSVPEPEETYVKSMDSYSTETTTSDKKTVITTYSYSFDWSKDDTKAPYLLLKIPFTKEGESTGVDYYYRIPVRSANDTKLNRNTIYRVTADLQTLGSTSELLPDVPVNSLQYNVYPWTVDETKISADYSSYLMVDPTFIVLKNCSTNVNNVINYYSSSQCTITINSVYYYDKDGKKWTIESDGKRKDESGNYKKKGSGRNQTDDTSYSGQYPTVVFDNSKSTTSSNNSGKIEITSAVPTNLTVKFIKFTVKNKDDRSEEVTVKQYPLEYVQSYTGFYSTRTEDKWVKYTSESVNNGIYNFNGYGQYNTTNKNLTGFSGEQTGSNENFNAKIKYDNVSIIQYFHYEKDGRSKKLQTKEDYINLTNNRMYIVQITSTTKSDGKTTNYTIAKPVNNNDNVVSPAFMLASQLGAVNSTYYKSNTAAGHCKTYKEVAKDKDGKLTEFTGWRLPTPAEIAVITDYQYNNKQDAITEVLSGYSYYTLNGKTAIANSSDDQNNKAVRCVRDLTPEEVAELEAKKE